MYYKKSETCEICVYKYFDGVIEGYVCQDCIANEDQDFWCDTLKDLAIHLIDHVRNGDKIPNEILLDIINSEVK